MRSMGFRFLVALCLALALASMAGARTPAATKTVAIQNFAFSPASVTVNVGDTVTWTNGDTAPHTATRAESPAFDTGNIENGQSGSVTFSTAGTFAYACKIHPNMQGTVVVEAAAQPAATAAPGGSPNLPPTGAGDSGDLGWLLALGALLALGGALLLRRKTA